MGHKRRAKGLRGVGMRCPVSGGDKREKERARMRKEEKQREQELE